MKRPRATMSESKMMTISSKTKNRALASLSRQPSNGWDSSKRTCQNLKNNTKCPKTLFTRTKSSSISSKRRMLCLKLREIRRTSTILSWIGFSSQKTSAPAACWAIKWRIKVLRKDSRITRFKAFKSWIPLSRRTSIRKWKATLTVFCTLTAGTI